MASHIYNINEKICGYAICVTFFSILLSTAVVNVGILLAVISGLIILIKDKQCVNTFIKNRINLSIVLLMLVFLMSTFYTIASFDEAISSLKKYGKLLYIPVCYYIFKIEWVKSKAINYFIAGSTIVLILSYLKYLNVISPSHFGVFSNFFSSNFGSNYEDKLLGGVTIFQHSIIHGVVLSFYFFITFLKAQKTNNLLYYLLSFLIFYNILFMNISRTSYIITVILLIVTMLILKKGSSVLNSKIWPGPYCKKISLKKLKLFKESTYIDKMKKEW